MKNLSLTKICKRCGENKSLKEFYKGDGKLGCKSNCKPCTLIKNMESRKKNWSKYLKDQKNWRDKNPEKCRARESKRLKENKKEILARLKIYKEANKPYRAYQARLERLAVKRIAEYKYKKEHKGDLDCVCESDKWKDF